MRLLNCIVLILTTALAAAAGGTGSLWTAPGSREQGMATDNKAGRVGDILTIVVSETAAQTSSQSKSTTTDSAVDSSVTQFLYPAAVSNFGTRGGNLPATVFGGTSGYSGGGSVSNTQSLTARAAVQVTDILPNGNLVIAGSRRVTFSGETQIVVLHGIVRLADISAANTILSSNIADAHLEFISQGELSDAQKRGWFSRLYEFLRPF